MALYNENPSAGMGVWFYYFGGGADSPYAGNYPSAYCWGWHQGKKAVADANQYFSSYVVTAWVMSLDIEQNALFGWSNQTQVANRQVLNGFRDFVDGASSADSNCTASNESYIYQPMIYSSPDQWSYSFGSFSAANTPIWTSEYQPLLSAPSGFGSGSTGAQWFANSNYNDQWQFQEPGDCGSCTGDYDQLQEPVYLPLWGISIGS